MFECAAQLSSSVVADVEATKVNILTASKATPYSVGSVVHQQGVVGNLRPSTLTSQILIGVLAILEEIRLIKPRLHCSSPVGLSSGDVLIDGLAETPVLLVEIVVDSALLGPLLS